MKLRGESNDRARDLLCGRAAATITDDTCSPVSASAAARSTVGAKPAGGEGESRGTPSSSSVTGESRTRVRARAKAQWLTRAVAASKAAMRREAESGCEIAARDVESALAATAESSLRREDAV